MIFIYYCIVSVVFVYYLLNKYWDRIADATPLLKAIPKRIGIIISCFTAPLLFPFYLATFIYFAFRRMLIHLNYYYHTIKIRTQFLWWSIPFVRRRKARKLAKNLIETLKNILNDTNSVSNQGQAADIL